MSEFRSRLPRGRFAPLARHGMLRKSNPLLSALKFLGIAVAVLSVSAASITAIAVADVLNTVKPGVDLVAPSNGVPPTIGPISGAVNILLAGSDSGGGDPQYGVRTESLNDVTILLHISADHKNASVVSFPRDMFVPIPACPKAGGGYFSAMALQKINVSLSYGGLACTVLTVEKLTGLTIPYAAEIQFNGVAAMSNAVGGVPVCVAQAINDPWTGIHLAAGMHTLQGEEALQFLRTRHGVGDGSDLGRISNQQVFLSALMRTVKSANTLSNPITLLKLAKAAASNMVLSKSLNHIDTMISIAVALKTINLNNFVFVQYPTSLTTIAGQGGVIPVRSAASELTSALAADRPVILTGKTGLGAVAAPSASPSPTPTPSTPATGSRPASSTPTPAPSNSAPAVVLPGSVTGQTAIQQTCSKGNGH